MKDLIACDRRVGPRDSIGYDLVEYHPRLWNPDKGKRIVHLDFEPAEIDEHYHRVELVGDIAHALDVQRAGQAKLGPRPAQGDP